jgi:DNA-binding transcriptional LysR family regulator
MRFTLKQLAYFVAAGESESITGAAQAANVSPASISAAVSQLEAEFGVQLCVRHHAQGVSLTPAGRQLRDAARRLLGQADDLQFLAKGLAGTVAGSLEIGCFQTFAASVVPRLIAGFRATFPEVDIACVVGHQEELHAGLRSGRFLVALTYDLELDPNLRFAPIDELPPYAILPEDHRLASMTTLALAALAPEPMVFLDLPLSRAYFLSLFYSCGLEPNIAYRFGTSEMVEAMVANGLGYGLLNARLHVDRSRDGKRFVARSLSDRLRPLRLGLAWRADVRLTRAAEAFLEHCRTALRPGAG